MYRIDVSLWEDGKDMNSSDIISNYLNELVDLKEYAKEFIERFCENGFKSINEKKDYYFRLYDTDGYLIDNCFGTDIM